MRYLVRLMPFYGGRNADPTYSVVSSTSARDAVAAQIGSDCTVSGDDAYAYAYTDTSNQEDRGESWGTRHEWEAASEDYIRRRIAADTGQYDETDLEHFEEQPS
ncbi:hypothetical protein G3N56_07725 [Desulfovibrio sulfodismutans]|uniref:Uncharacterized protein n=1 Tax=Desulfolutivibrio sulfodismutans TaxID=63561 RepID=A0A7K3NKC3_9BACT|nr:hypothetical protein [Desulfolutivibrio sulfodismutans]NDY56630.1 hypothetical protein [Desulfolutivibrio sulfodismutans]QLA11269.1 hypothetical protein GD606_02730 [Desulfolutivibrio sulfodismutans DSM 3696]